MSDLEVKKDVRARDGFRCRDCGMTSEEHQEKYGADLEVHRLIPGSAYAASVCVTLCRKCHDKKPSKLNHLFRCLQPGEPDTALGMVIFFFNAYAPEDAKQLSRLRAIADLEDKHIVETLDEVVKLGLSTKESIFHTIEPCHEIDFDLSAVHATE